MKTVFALTACFLFTGASYAEWNSEKTFDAGSMDYKNSPLNYENSSLNYENSELNWKNSSMNWDNSTMNSKRKSVYDEDGDSVGYVVEKDNGGSNIFSNSGKRIGYVPED